MLLELKSLFSGVKQNGRHETLKMIRYVKTEGFNLHEEVSSLLVLLDEL